MKNFIIYVAVALCVFCSKIVAQETKNDLKNQEKIISKRTDSILKSEKSKLKLAISAINLDLKNGSINKQQRNDKKAALKIQSAAETKKLVLIELKKLSKFYSAEFNRKTAIEDKAKIILMHIGNISKAEKAKLKLSLETVNSEFDKGTITQQQADDKKLDLASKTASNIEKLVGIEQEKLNQLVQDKIDEKTDKIEESFTWSFFGAFDDTFQRSERRTTNQIVFAFGLNNVITNNAVADSDFRYFGSHFYEWGITYNTRIAKDNNLLHAKYGFSVMYNNLRPTDNRSFVVSGNQTTLQTNSINTDDSRFKNVYLVFPVHLELDFTKTKIENGKTIFNSHEGFRFGIGGYAGINLKSKQYLEFKSNDNETSTETKGDFNTSNFIYGISTYISYGETGLYVKYDLNPLFRDNIVKQNNVSLGVRWDFN